MVPQFNWSEHLSVTQDVTGSSPVGIANYKLVVSFGANVVLTVETKTGMSSEADLNVDQRQMSGIGNAADCGRFPEGGILMQLNSNADRGRAGLSLAIAYFGTNGYTVSLPMNDTQWYDLIVEKDGVFQTVQCKFTATENKVIDFRSHGGTKGTVYGNLKDSPLDILFVQTMNRIYS